MAPPPFAVFLLLSCGLHLVVGASEQPSDRVCEDNSLTPDDEREGAVWEEFAEKLEMYTGLDNANFSVTLDKCGGTTCRINPKGSAIWEARAALYANNMMDDGAATVGEKTTLDGCLCYSTSVDDYQGCMETVRKRMVGELDETLLSKFVEIVGGDCSSIEQNCVVRAD